MRLVIRNEILEDRHVDLVPGAIIVGRDKEAHLVFSESGVSRFHARFEVEGPDVVRITDLGSSNGTFVNGMRLSEPTLARPGDVLRVGNVTMTLVRDDDAAPNAAASTPAAEGRRPARRVLLLLTAAALGLLGLSLALLFSRRKEIDPPAPSPPPAAASPHDTEVRPADEAPEAPAPVDPVVQQRDPPSGTQPETPPPATPPPPAPSEFSFHDGKRRSLRIRDASPVTHVLVENEARKSEEIPRETIVAIDGVAQTADLPAIFAARFATARDLERLRALLPWCRSFGLEAELRRVAQAIVDSEPMDREANALLGRFRIRGAWMTRAELETRGLLDPAGQPIPADRELREIRRLYFALLDRPPLPDEMVVALELPRAELVARLVVDPETWSAWLADLATEILGDGGERFVIDHPDLVAELASGASDFRAALRRLAGCEALLVRHPEPAGRARALVLAILGPGVADAATMAAAGRMMGGERVALFGERGASADDLGAILLRQPASFRRRVEHLAKRWTTLAPDATALSKATFELAATPGKLRDLGRSWLLSDAEVAAIDAKRTKTVRQLARGALVDAYGRRPDAGEVDALSLLATALDGPTGLRAVLPGLLARGNELFDPGHPEGAGDHWAAATWWRVLGRSPRPAEAATAREALMAGPAGRATLVRALLALPEYCEY